jgi:hypothetical protein
MAEEGTKSSFNPANYLLILIVLVLLALGVFWYKDRKSNALGSAEDNLTISMCHEAEAM